MVRCGRRRAGAGKTVSEAGVARIEELPDEFAAGTTKASGCSEDLEACAGVVDELTP